MATVVQPFSGARAAKAPISAHPAFPAIVALWFAALLGLGSLVLPVALIEKLVTVTGVASVVPAAQPPLGFTARAGIALCASIVGALVGLFLARKVAASAAPLATARSFSIGAERHCRPISAHEELGGDSLDSVVDVQSSRQVLKRRSLAMAEDSGPSAYLQAVPLPGQSGDYRPDVATAGATPPDDALTAAGPAGDSEPEPLELGEFTTADEFAEESVEIEPDDGLEALRHRIHTPDAQAMQDSPMTDEIFGPTLGSDDGDAPEVSAIERNRGRGEPLPFAAPSLRRSPALSVDEEVAAEISPDDDAFEATDDGFQKETVPQLTIVDPSGEVDADDRPVEELGLVQLAARLSASIERRRAWLAERQNAFPVSPALAPFDEADDFEAAAAEDAARAMADFFGPASVADDTGPAPRTEVKSELAEEPFVAHEPALQPTIPAALRGVTLDHDEHDDDDALAASFSLPLGNSLSAIDALSDSSDSDEFDEEGPDDGEYGSLMAMKNPFVRQQEFVRVDEPLDDSGVIEPVVSFPISAPLPTNDVEASQAQGSPARPFDPPKKPVESAFRAVPPAAARDSGDAERNLRDALATLQRMSGAG